MKTAPSITGYDFDDVDGSPPEDPSDFDFWMTVTVGDERGGSSFQLHVCSPAAIGGIADKKALFVLDEWRGEHDLIARLDAFIADELRKHPGDDPYEAPSRHWLWEYAGMR